MKILPLFKKDKRIETPIGLQENKRLLFIDMARSIAILLMLEGHFISWLFENHHSMANAFNIRGTSGNIFFDIWHFIRGHTAPMFFTVTGIVFVFLLIDNKKIRDNIRVKKGFKRAIELILWGYLLQMNILSIPQYIIGDFSSYSVAFHVLQSIGMGILVLLLLYILHRLLKIGNLALYYFLGATTILLFYPYIKSIPTGEFFPEHAPAIIQNMFKGPRSVFPIIPWMAFTLYGGMIGAIIKKYKHKIKSNLSILFFVAVGLILAFFSAYICQLVDILARTLKMNANFDFVSTYWFYARLGVVLCILGLLIFIEKMLVIKPNLFLKIGQNTLPIFIVHMIILYGCLFGVGLKTIIGRQLNGIESVIGAALFIAFFVVMIRYWEQIEQLWGKIKKILTAPFKFFR